MIECNFLDYKSKNLIFDKYFLNVDFLITRAYTGFIFCLISLHIHLEGTVSQIFYLGPSFYFIAKNGKHFINFVII